MISLLEAWIRFPDNVSHRFRSHYCCVSSLTTCVILQVRLCNGKLMSVTACEKGFYSCSKQLKLHDHSLVVLLCRLSKSFAKVCACSRQVSFSPM